MEYSQQELQHCAYWYCLFQHWGVNMTNYSGCVEHSDFYIAPQSYQDAFEFLCQLAFESEETVFYIGKAIEYDKSYGFDEDDNFYLEDEVMFVWNEDKGEWVSN